ncbi:MAG: hypothetical protein GW939_00585 [Candidatus Magasanikbacteria bacterium]|uniref:Uncharacterized protein n=1 Tax=Candidatus Magasanikbacteria bacterium CG10_big_fil_rev_8_21_14_0_10_38_6 TaxID=1974647 RepID=A0A2M6NZL6_9BACT|nr:hypothetical protein [Candidatus Magasanikbacteria bacterium]NCS72271.1 hypothetical protein [Candidatus Magasanikbacteria bacterium]PIR76868.1 MAG: hypothetical protein COU30_05550 [Candidatus Magasanikbacteria bacterium CG10_big_fil_rev_8_21_14_0_10_38_6]
MSIPTLQEVDAYPVPELLIPRIEKEHGYSLNMATALVREAKRMLYLSAREKTVVSPSHDVDMAWHEMLMFTRFYQEFAEFIGKFIHHDPTPGPPDGGNIYKATKQKYQEAFGEKVDQTLWP